MARGTASDAEYEHWKNDINFINDEIKQYNHIIHKADKNLSTMIIGSPQYTSIAQLRHQYLEEKRSKEKKLVEMREFLKDHYSAVYVQLSAHSSQFN